MNSKEYLRKHTWSNSRHLSAWAWEDRIVNTEAGIRMGYLLNTMLAENITMTPTTAD
jgi:hypothetical protein